MTAATPDPSFRDKLAGARVHDLKVWPPYFDALADGSKTFELRRDDRGFAVGDVLRLREWQPPIPNWGVKGGYTGREVTRSVSYVLDDAEDFGLAPGFVVLGLIAAEVEAHVQAAANQRAAKMPRVGAGSRIHVVGPNADYDVVGLDTWDGWSAGTLRLRGTPEPCRCAALARPAQTEDAER